MKKMFSLLGVLMLVPTFVLAIGRDGTRSMSDFTGDNISFQTVSVSSGLAAASTLASYSTSRGALTIVNTSTGTIYLSSSSVVGSSAAIPSGQSAEFRSNAVIYGVTPQGAGPQQVGVILEW